MVNLLSLEKLSADDDITTNWKLPNTVMKLYNGIINRIQFQFLVFGFFFFVVVFYLIFLISLCLEL